MLESIQQAAIGWRWVWWCALLSSVLLADWLNKHTQSPLFRALVDNAGHSAIGGLCWGCTLMCCPYSVPVVQTGGSRVPRCLQRVLVRLTKDPLLLRVGFEMAIAAACSSLLDLDHFIAAQSATLHGATHLSERPFGHAILFVVIVAIAVGCCCQSINASWLLASSLLTHQLRDATRRGIWFWPLGSSQPLYYPLYVTIVMALPILISSRLELQEDDWSSGDESSDLESGEEMRFLNV